jgi:hypothetical protein
MKEGGKVHRNTVQFKEAADKLGWPDNVPRWLYSNSLLNCIKALWACTDLPSDFNDLVGEAQRADTQYWRRVDGRKEGRNCPQQASGLASITGETFYSHIR